MWWDCREKVEKDKTICFSFRNQVYYGVEYKLHYMTENNIWKESLALKDTPKFLQDKRGEWILDRNRSAEYELMGLRKWIEQEKISPILRSHIDRLERRTSPV